MFNKFPVKKNYCAPLANQEIHIKICFHLLFPVGYFFFLNQYRNISIYISKNFIDLMHQRNKRAAIFRILCLNIHFCSASVSFYGIAVASE